MNALRIIALSVLLAAGGSLAASKKKQAPPPNMPKPVLTEADRPKNCADQCKVLEKVMTDPCKQSAGSKKQAQQMCTNQAKQMVDACNGSCKEKGRIDKQYIMEHVKPPAGFKGAQEGAKNKAAQEGDDAH